MTALRAKMNASAFDGDDNSTVIINGSDVNYTGLQQQDETLINWTTIITLRDVVWYMALALGIPGSILSAIVWLRYYVARKSSSAIYLVALAIANLVYLLSRFLCLYIIQSHVHVLDGWIWCGANYVAGSAGILEPLLLLSFSVERLIAILHPMQVCRMRFACTLQ